MCENTRVLPPPPPPPLGPPLAKLFESTQLKGAKHILWHWINHVDLFLCV